MSAAKAAKNLNLLLGIRRFNLNKLSERIISHLINNTLFQDTRFPCQSVSYGRSMSDRAKGGSPDVIGGNSTNLCEDDGVLPVTAANLSVASQSTSCGFNVY